MFFPQVLSAISRSGEILALLTVKNEQKKFFCSYSVLIWYLVPEKLLATTIWGDAQETHLYLLPLHKLYDYNRDEILKCCNIYQPFSQIPSQKTVHDGNKSWTHYPFSSYNLALQSKIHCKLSSSSLIFFLPVCQA